MVLTHHFTGGKVVMSIFFCYFMPCSDLSFITEFTSLPTPLTFLNGLCYMLNSNIKLIFYKPPAKTTFPAEAREQCYHVTKFDMAS